MGEGENKGKEGGKSARTEGGQPSTATLESQGPSRCWYIAWCLRLSYTVFLFTLFICLLLILLLLLLFFKKVIIVILIRFMICSLESARY